MYKSDNDNMIRALTFEMVILKVLKLYNPNLKENYYDYNKKYQNNLKESICQYDGFIENELDLNKFGCGIVKANEIIICHINQMKMKLKLA